MQVGELMAGIANRIRAPEANDLGSRYQARPSLNLKQPCWVSMTADLVLIAPAKDRARDVRRSLGRALRACFRDHGDNLAGFAIVTWDMRGEVASALRSDVGPIGRSMVPMFAHDALNRHVAVLISEGPGSVPIDGKA